jgi:hypothetical protein
MASPSEIYPAVLKVLCPVIKYGKRGEKMKSIHGIVDTVLEQIKHITVTDGSVRLKHLGTLELIKGDSIRTTFTLRPSKMLIAELNPANCDQMLKHKYWSKDESAELMRLNSIKEGEQLLGWEWVARCLTLKFSNYRTPKSCKERVARIKELEAKHEQ